MKYISGRTIDELLMDDGFRLRRHSALHKPLKSALDKLELGITEGQPRDMFNCIVINEVNKSF